MSAILRVLTREGLSQVLSVNAKQWTLNMQMVIQVLFSVLQFFMFNLWTYSTDESFDNSSNTYKSLKNYFVIHNLPCLNQLFFLSKLRL